MKAKMYFLAVTLIMISITSPGQIIYVDVNNTSGIENGTLQYPFNTIEEGFAVAQDRDTIMIAGGTYLSPSLLIPKCITIMGENRDSTIIEGSMILSSLLDSVPVKISRLKCNNVQCSDSGRTKTPLTIELCRLQMLYDTTGIVDSTGMFLLQNTLITDSIHIANKTCRGKRELTNCETGSGVWVSSVISKGNIRIIGNQIGRNVHISTISRTDTILVAQNLISDSLVILSVSTKPNFVTDNVIGKGLRVAATSSLSNQILNNQITHGSIKCSFVSVSPVSIKNNELLNGGIDFTGRSANVEISNNVIYSDGTVSGIKFTSYSGGIIEGNDVILPYLPPTGVPVESDTNAICAVWINSVSFQGMSGNSLMGGSYGIYTRGISSSHISNSTISNSHTGIYLASVSCRVDSNSIKNCVGDGMILSAPVDIDTNAIHVNFDTVTNNGGHGVRVKNNAILGLYSDPATGFNIFRDNIGYDIYIETPASLFDTIYAQNNAWTHTSESEISDFDVYDGKDDDSRSVVLFTPFNILAIKDGITQPGNFLSRNFPNPFSQSTIISWQIPFGSRQSAVDSQVTLRIFDFMGKEVKTLVADGIVPGEHQVTFDASGLPSGVYFYQLQTNGTVETKKMMVYR